MHRLIETSVGYTISDSGWTLAELRHHYRGAYSIQGEGGIWIAVRTDGKGTLRADSADGLLDLIRADAAAFPVPR